MRAGTSSVFASAGGGGMASVSWRSWVMRWVRWPLAVVLRLHTHHFDVCHSAKRRVALLHNSAKNAGKSSRSSLPPLRARPDAQARSTSKAAKFRASLLNSTATR